MLLFSHNGPEPPTLKDTYSSFCNFIYEYKPKNMEFI